MCFIRNKLGNKVPVAHVLRPCAACGTQPEEQCPHNSSRFYFGVLHPSIPRTSASIDHSMALDMTSHSESVLMMNQTSLRCASSKAGVSASVRFCSYHFCGEVFRTYVSNICLKGRRNPRSGPHPPQASPISISMLSLSVFIITCFVIISHSNALDEPGFFNE